MTSESEQKYKTYHLHAIGALMISIGALVLGATSRVHLKSPNSSDFSNFTIGTIIASNIAKLTNINVILHYRLLWRTKCQ
ncbi:hypothetical protein GAGA_2943 [Paraglaciecola agarilytica NO2]|uniref:Uncharacterized protein n=2 Tax=Paraglaciecola chathamensis TaxID=368405 RepID=A0ABQ0I920_9ALTE|nr:hypothetical protein GAGA_2943 [Paraglaciecola agarilytica NO2]